MTSASSKKLKTGNDDVNVAAHSHFVSQEEEVKVPSQKDTIEDVEVPSHITSTAQQTASSLKKVGTKKKRLGRKGVHTSQSTIPIEEGDPDAEHKVCIQYASDTDSTSDDDTPVNYYVVVDYELLPTGLGSINAFYRKDNSCKCFTSLREILHLVTRADLMTIYGHVMTFYQDKKATGVGLVLWGDFKVLMDSPKRPKVPDWYAVPTGRVKVPAGRYVVPTGKDNVIITISKALTMTSSSADESQNHPEKTQTQNVQQIVTTTVSNNNAKFPYLKKDEYETWAMKMEYWIMNSDHHLWNVVLNGNSKKNVGRDPKGNIIILPPVSAEEQIAVQRETKARTLLLQSLPEDHMADFHHLDDARDIWLAVKARFGGNEESKKMRKSMLKQEFQEFRVSEDEGLHKGYDRFQKILSQLNQLQAKPDNEDCNIKFLRALPSSWSQVAITLKAKGGLDYLNFDDLYNKLKSLEIDIKGGSSYKSNHSAAPSHSAFVSTTSGNNKMSYAETSKQSSSYISASPGSNVSHFNSGNVMEDVLHSFVAESDQQIIYEDFDQIGKLDLEELDIKWQMAMEFDIKMY
ncbi:hypothetical protein Tco_1284601 [Tanacetum coccineum]